MNSKKEWNKQLANSYRSLKQIGVNYNIAIPAVKDNTALWATSASSKEDPQYTDSKTLNDIFAGGKKSFSAKIQGNSYNNWELPFDKPSDSKLYNGGNLYEFKAGGSYNIMINPDTMAMEITESK